jgi:hypothetical protein
MISSSLKENFVHTYIAYLRQWSPEIYKYHIAAHIRPTF